MGKKNLKKTYQSLLQTGRDFLALEQDALSQEKLLPGSYKLSYDARNNQLRFIEFNSNSDAILDLPSNEFNRVVNEMKHFLKPETKRKFLDMGFLYKRSALLYGLPGTGKTIIVNRVMQEVIKSGGICLFVDDPRVLPIAYDVLTDLQPDTTILTVLEEFDGLIDQFGQEPFLSILDGEIQKENVMYLATTNYIEKIPKRLIRPGRISSIIEVFYPSVEARTVYFKNKLEGRVKNLNEYIEKTAGLSIDELKEVVQATYIFGNKIDEVISRILVAKGLKNEDGSSNKLTIDDMEELLEDMQEAEYNEWFGKDNDDE